MLRCALIQLGQTSHRSIRGPSVVTCVRHTAVSVCRIHTLHRSLTTSTNNAQTHTQNQTQPAPTFLPPPFIPSVPRLNGCEVLRGSNSKQRIAQSLLQHLITLEDQLHQLPPHTPSHERAALEAAIVIAREKQHLAFQAAGRKAGVYSRIVERGLKSLLAEFRHRAPYQTKHDVEARWKAYAAGMGWTEVKTWAEFEKRFLQSRRIEIDWICSDELPSERTETLLAHECRMSGDYRPSGSGSLRSLLEYRWNSGWKYRFEGPPEPLPPTAIKRSMIEVLLRDAIILRAAPLLLEPTRQQGLYLAFHEQLKNRLRTAYERERWAARKEEIKREKAEKIAAAARLRLSQQQPLTPNTSTLKYPPQLGLTIANVTESTAIASSPDSLSQTTSRSFKRPNTKIANIFGNIVPRVAGTNSIDRPSSSSTPSIDLLGLSVKPDRVFKSPEQRRIELQSELQSLLEASGDDDAEDVQGYEPNTNNDDELDEEDVNEEDDEELTTDSNESVDELESEETIESLDTHLAPNAASSISSTSHTSNHKSSDIYPRGVPPGSEDLRRSNANFFARLKQYQSGERVYIATPLAVSPETLQLSTFELYQKLSVASIARAQHRLLRDFAAAWDLPQPLLRRILDITDARVQREYEALAAEVEKLHPEIMTEFRAKTNSLDYWSNLHNTSNQSDQVAPPLPDIIHPLHAHIHEKLIAANPCYAQTGGLIRSLSDLPSLTPDEEEHSREFLANLLLAVHRAIQPNQLSRETLLNGYVADDIVPNVIHPDPATPEEIAQLQREHAEADRLRAERWTQKQAYLKAWGDEKYQNLKNLDYGASVSVIPPPATDGTNESSDIDEPTNEPPLPRLHFPDVRRNKKFKPTPDSYDPPSFPSTSTPTTPTTPTPPPTINEFPSSTPSPVAIGVPTPSADNSSHPSSPLPLNMAALRREVDGSIRNHLQRTHAQKFETHIRDFLDAHGIRYIDEQWLKKNTSGLYASPDIILLDQVFVRIHYPQLSGPARVKYVQLRWLELKAIYGACIQYGHPHDQRAWPSPTIRSWLEQSQRYVTLFGPGAVIFESAFCLEWLKPIITYERNVDGKDVPIETPRLPPGVTFLDFTYSNQYEIDRVNYKRERIEESQQHQKRIEEKFESLQAALKEI